MKLRREGDVVVVVDDGHAEDDTIVHQFTVVEDFCRDPLDVLHAEAGVQPKAAVSYARSETRDQLGTHRWQSESPPTQAKRHLETRGYVVITKQME